MQFSINKKISQDKSRKIYKLVFAINKIKQLFRNIQKKKFKQQIQTLFNPKKRANQSTFLLSEQEKEFLKIPLIYDELCQRKLKENNYFIELEEKFSSESIIFECDNYFDSYPLLKLRIKMLYVIR